MKSLILAATILLLVTAGTVLHIQATAVPSVRAGGCSVDAAAGWPIGPPGSASAAAAKAEPEDGPFYLIGAAHVPGFNDTQWRTSLEVCNFSGTTRSYELALLLRSQENSGPQTVPLNLAPGLCVNYPDVVATVFDLDQAVGSLRLSADGDGVVATARTYNDTPDGTYGTAIEAMGARSETVYGENVALIHLAQAAADATGFRTNLDLLNVTAIEIDIEVVLFSSDGTRLGSVMTHLNPYEYHQTMRVFRRVTAQEVDDGYAVVRTTTEGGAFLTAASLVDNRTGDTTTITGQAVPTAERWLEAVNIGAVINTTADDWYPILSRDGSYMIFVSRGRGGYGDGDLFISRFVGGEWQAPENLGPNVNTSGFESAPYLSRDERTLYFTTNDGGILDSFDLWSCPMSNGVPGESVKIQGVNTTAVDCCPVISPDGNSLYICTDRPGSFGNLDVFVSHRVNGAWQSPVSLGEAVNSAAIDSPRWISDDGRTLIIESLRPGRIGGSDMWTVTRINGEWQAPVNLGAPINSRWDEWGPGFLDNDGGIAGRIFFGSDRPGGLGGWDIWFSDFASPTPGKAAAPGISRGLGPSTLPDWFDTDGAEETIPPSSPCCSKSAR